MREGQEPDNVDKEFLRLWFTENCNPYEDDVLPPAPDDLVIELSRRYIYLYETITGRSFEFPEADPIDRDTFGKQPRRNHVKVYGWQ